MRLIYHPDAEAELVAAAQFYEQRVSTLGAQFLDAVDQGVRAILDAPERWPIIEGTSDATLCLASHIRFTIVLLLSTFVSLLSNIIGAIRIIGVTVLPSRK